MSKHSTRNRRGIAAGALALAGAAMLGWAFLQPQKEAAVPGWTPVNGQVAEALERANGAALPSPLPSESAGKESSPASPAVPPESAAPADASASFSPSPANDPTSGTVASSGGLLNLNAATADQLDALKGIGPSKAQAIVAYRNEHGAFRSVEELLQVKGIGPKLLAAIRDQVTI
ncbi:ComEA family DNA-binding protein [Cohnella sp. AR92]|uniref:ComEA family DNA-binding protein n=1 Tax=Cohnella sp. AR92 TaxID=648716 RepID=UPI000F8E558B|nr:ComEA family DNA-binding protein [Cohnella sp. AR92]RUS48555.1 helix-hairpin-helix domain-containing protein [Cohnella sp. AR92]